MLSLKLPKKQGECVEWGGVHQGVLSFAISKAVTLSKRLTVVIVPDQLTCTQLKAELSFFLQGEDCPILTFPDWETLPFDHFSPYKDIISERLYTLSQLPTLAQGILIISVPTLMHRLAPCRYIEKNCFILNVGDALDLKVFQTRLDNNGYQFVSEVISHGEYSVRGSILDIFPTGSQQPYRIDLFDNEIDSIRIFDAQTQRTIQKIDKIRLLPAREFPLNEESISIFRQTFRTRFEVNPTDCPVYQNISQHQTSAGIEYYLPLFFDQLGQLFDYLHENCLLIRAQSLDNAAQNFWQKVSERYEQLCHDITRPILSPKEVFLSVDELFASMKNYCQIQLKEVGGHSHFETRVLPDVSVAHKAKQPLEAVGNYVQENEERVLFCTESLGRREALLSLLRKINLIPSVYETWYDFLRDEKRLGIVVAPMEHGLVLPELNVTLITEAQLFGQKVVQRRTQKATHKDFGTIIRDLSELSIGDPVVHVEHGVGRYRGLQNINTSGIEMEYLVLEYAGESKLYVPVASLHLINRFSGVEAEHAPWHSLGSKKWGQAKRRAAEKIRDVAAELLEIYAKRESRAGLVYKKPEDYRQFAEGFLFEETLDQKSAIDQVIQDMTTEKRTDRLICGDVGFGKTEVAMRAAFIAVQNHKQVALLVPTTVLAEQHYQNFKDRFANWPIEIDVISRFSTVQEQKKSLEHLKSGKTDIIVGTHKLLQPRVVFQSLGLLIIDEEHRFGVGHKEKIKAKKNDVDVLTLTATPIPRTLNMAMHSIRDLSIIATPPVGRLAVKTFVQKYNEGIIKEAILRENLRGGQVYFLHNRVETIERAADTLRALVPDAKVGVAHAQMPESQLERVMAGFHHQHFNVLVCSTIIESGIDIPTANTIIIERADRLGLAQLHQLRGRVGRSHHQAYAYLLKPAEGKITKDAEKRLDALAHLEDLGAGFNLASHDLEVRGAGELLGEEQSGHIQTIGFSLYMEFLERAVEALKKGEIPNLEEALGKQTEIDLKIPALIPETYVTDIHIRLTLYKRIASAKDKSELGELKSELIDRFGLVPDQVDYLFEVTQLKLKAEKLGIEKLKKAGNTVQIHFFESSNDKTSQVNVDTLINLIQTQSDRYQLKSNQVFSIILSEEKPEVIFQKIEECLKKISA